MKAKQERMNKDKKQHIYTKR